MCVHSKREKTNLVSNQLILSVENWESVLFNNDNDAEEIITNDMITQHTNTLIIVGKNDRFE